MRPGLPKHKSPSGYNSNSSENSSPSLFTGIVTDIILNQFHPLFIKCGGWGCIGTIEFSLLDRNNKKGTTTPSSQKLYAKPLTTNNNVYPTINEICFILPLKMDRDFTNPLNLTQYFYLPPTNLWNQPNSNFMPALKFPNQSSNQLEKETQVESYEDNIIPNTPLEEANPINFFPKESLTNPSQDTFEESPTSPLLPFSGDVITQGRWGNSMRLGSTSIPPPSYPPLNAWSKTGNNTDPIILIRNGLSNSQQTPTSIPIVEDINEDLSSIYQTSTQKIPIETINNKFTSYSEPPELPNSFTSPQVIINSDRLVFNAKKDHVLISGEKSIFLGGNKSVNINAGSNVIIECSDIKLGSKTAEEPLILGDTFLNNLDVVFTKLDQLCTQLTLSTIWPVGAPVADGGIITIASSLKKDLANFKANMSSYKSQVSKTK